MNPLLSLLGGMTAAAGDTELALTAPPPGTPVGIPTGAETETSSFTNILAAAFAATQTIPTNILNPVSSNNTTTVSNAVSTQANANPILVVDDFRNGVARFFQFDGNQLNPISSPTSGNLPVNPNPVPNVPNTSTPPTLPLPPSTNSLRIGGDNRTSTATVQANDSSRLLTSTPPGAVNLELPDNGLPSNGTTVSSNPVNLPVATVSNELFNTLTNATTLPSANLLTSSNIVVPQTTNLVTPDRTTLSVPATDLIATAPTDLASTVTPSGFVITATTNPERAISNTLQQPRTTTATPNSTDAPDNSEVPVPIVDPVQQSVAPTPGNSLSAGRSKQVPTLVPANQTAPVIVLPDYDPRPMNLPTGIDRPLDAIIELEPSRELSARTRGLPQSIAERQDLLELRTIATTNIPATAVNPVSFQTTLQATSEVRNERPMVISPAGQLADAFVTRAEVIRRQDMTEFQIRLDPPELGPVEIRVTQSQQGIHAEIHVGSESVRSLIEGQINELKNRLEQAGMNPQGFQCFANLSQDGSRRDRNDEWEELLAATGPSVAARKTPPIRPTTVSSNGSSLNVTA